MSEQTNAILLNVETQLRELILYKTKDVREDQFPKRLARQLEVARVQLLAFAESAKLESQSGHEHAWFRNMTGNMQATYERVAWYLELLTVWSNHHDE